MTLNLTLQNLVSCTLTPDKLVVTSFSYIGHIICNDLTDDADLKAKARQMYAKSKTLRQKFHMCSTAVKVKLFTAYNVYMCALWVNYRKIVQQPSRHFSLNLAKIPPNQVIADFGRGSSVESESE